MTSNPLLFMKTGTIGSAPIGFYADLSHAYEADYHATAQTARDLDLQGMRGSESASRIRRETQARVIASLVSGRSATYEGFLNRRHFREELVHKAIEQRPDTQVVLLAITETSRKLRLARIVERHDCADADTLPWEARRDLDRSDAMMRTIERPGPEENPLILDGSLPTPELLKIVDAHIAQTSQQSQQLTAPQYASTRR